MGYVIKHREWGWLAILEYPALWIRDYGQLIIPPGAMIFKSQRLAKLALKQHWDKNMVDQFRIIRKGEKKGE